MKRAGLPMIGGLSVLALVLAGCGNGDGGSAAGESGGGPEFPLTVQNCGQDITIDRAPEKILAIGHEAVEIIVAAGGADRIVARAGGVTAPEPYGSQVEAPEVVSGDPSTEEIIGTGVDLVVSYGLFDVEPQSLADAGIASFIVSGLCGTHGGGVGEGASFEGVMDDITLFGRMFGTEQTAADSIAGLQERLDAIEGEFADRDWTGAGGFFFDTQLGTTGNQSMNGAILEHLGIRNVFDDVDADYVLANFEELIDRDPDLFILSFYEPDETADSVVESFLALPGASDMSAMVNDRVIAFRYVYSQASPSAVAGAESVAEALRGG